MAVMPEKIKIFYLIMLLQVKNLFWKNILKNINLYINKGELVGIIGPNGSGKSSLVKCIYRINKPSDGKILLNTSEGFFDIWKMKSKDVSRKIAVVPQEMSGEFDFTVSEIVSMGRYPHKGMLEKYNKKDFDLISSSLERVGMLEKSKNSFLKLSGGEKQRVLIARALVQEAEILILDEPVNHLDIYYQLEIMELVKNPEITCLIVLHDLNLAAQYCDRIYVINNGEIFSQGKELNKPSEILTPELIKKIYNVQSEILFNHKNNKIQIFFSK